MERIGGLVPDFTFEKSPGALVMYLELEKRIDAEMPGVRAKASSSQVGFYSKRLFAVASLLRPCRKEFLPEEHLTISIGLSHQLVSPRCKASVVPYPARWTNHVVIGSVDEIDDELMGWLKEAALFADTK